MTVSHPDDRSMRVQQLKHLIANAEYAVDPHAVAEALLRRADLQDLWAQALSRPRARSRRSLEARSHPHM
jgi:hypothetical protein